MKKINRLWLFILSVCILLSAFSASVWAEENLNDYGARAYQFLQYLESNYPNRINNHEITEDTSTLRAAGQWICDTIAGFGYEPVIYEQEIEEHDFIDYCFRKHGESEKRIVIGAHYDCVDTHGCEDNGTGVAALMELARRFRNKATPMTLEFCFFDGEEYRGFAGSYIYLDRCEDPENIALYINLDCLGAGDLMYAYGGEYDESGRLLRDWGLQMALALSDELNIDLHTLPETVARFRTPTRDDSSDHYYFMKNEIPYVYFEANMWVNEDGSVNDEKHPYFLNTRNEAFSDTNGQIIHTYHDDLSDIEAHLPGVIRQHLHDYCMLVSTMLERAGKFSEAFYSERLAPYDVIHQYAPEVSEEEASSEETEAETAEEPETTESESPEEEPDTNENSPDTLETVQEITEDSDTADDLLFSYGDYYIKKPESALDFFLYGLLALSLLAFPVSICLAIRSAVLSSRDPEARERKKRRKEQWKQRQE